MTLPKLRLNNRFNALKITIVVLIIGALITYPYIPKPTLNIYPGIDMWWGAYTDNSTGGNSSFQYLNDNQTAIRCTMGSSGSFNMCGNTGVFADDSVASYDKLVADYKFATKISPKITRDFSDYLGVWLDIKYSGPADFIYISLQNHEPTLDMTNASRQFRPQSVGVSTLELQNPVYIKLEDFKVGDWWVKQFSLHRSISGARFDRIRAFGIEVKDEPVGSEHFLEMKSIHLEGEWISREDFYLTIIIILAALLSIEGSMRVYNLYVAEHNAQIHLEELNEHNKNLQSAAYQDDLTKLLNRRAIYNIILKEHSLNKDHNLGLLVIDIDNFKVFNDTYGHATGDKVLEGVAEALRNASRDSDNIARWGGEEFVVITRESLRENLLKYAEKLRKAIASMVVYTDNDSKPVSITISIGATLAKPDEDFEDSFDRADTALYRSKKNGRNTSTFN